MQQRENLSTIDTGFPLFVTFADWVTWYFANTIFRRIYVFNIFWHCEYSSISKYGALGLVCPLVCFHTSIKIFSRILKEIYDASDHIQRLQSEVWSVAAHFEESARIQEHRVLWRFSFRIFQFCQKRVSKNDILEKKFNLQTQNRQ